MPRIIEVEFRATVKADGRGNEYIELPAKISRQLRGYDHKTVELTLIPQ